MYLLTSSLFVHWHMWQRNAFLAERGYKTAMWPLARLLWKLVLFCVFLYISEKAEATIFTFYTYR